MGNIFTVVLVRPLLNLLVFVYNGVPNVGIVIIILTLIVRLLLLPSFHKSLKAQKAMADLQPRLNEARAKYKDNKEEQAKAVMDLYKEHKVNPLSSCLPLLIQLPLLIAMYSAIRLGLGNADLGSQLYHFVHNPGHLNPFFLGINLSTPAFVLGIIAGAAQFVQSKMMVRNTAGAGADAATKAMAIQTVYMLPALTVLISLRLPAGLPLYWIVTTLFAIGQQYYIIKTTKPKEAIPVL